METRESGWFCEGSWRREYAAGSCEKEEKKKNKTAGALWFVNVAAVLGKQQTGEKKINQKGELPAVVGEKPKNQWGSGCVSEKKEKISQGLPGGSFQ